MDSQCYPQSTKQLVRLPKVVLETLLALMLDIELGGPVRGDWPNYGKLDAKTHHCHLKKGHPTYGPYGKKAQTA